MSGIKIFISYALTEHLSPLRFISVRGAVSQTTSRRLSNLAQTSEVAINHPNVSCITQRWFAASGL